MIQPMRAMAMWVLLPALMLVLSPARPCAAAAGELPEEMDDRIVAAVERGLDHLATVQQPDGSFPESWEGRAYPAVMTSLAGLAFMANGSTPTEGPYSEQIHKAMVYLIELGENHPDGLIAGPVEMRSTYGHSFGMLFLAHCYGMEPSIEYEARIRSVLERAVELVQRGQSPRGGWLYSPTGGGDEGSTTAGVLQGLRACRNVGIKVSSETINRAVGYLRYTQNPDGGIAYSAVHRGASRPSLAAAAITCFYSAGIYDRASGGDSPESVMVDKLWRYLETATAIPEAVRGHYFYHHFYLAQAEYQRGGESWRRYYAQISEELLQMQSANGTWPGDDVGTTYGTAISCIVLQLPLACLPITER